MSRGGRVTIRRADRLIWLGLIALAAERRSLYERGHDIVFARQRRPARENIEYIDFSNREHIILDMQGAEIDAGPTSLLRLGLPPGYASRTVERRYGALTVHLAGRFDQVCFKLYAAVDQGPRSKHATDLRSLQPTSDELLSAARWALTHDPSEPFRDQLGQALEAFGCVDHGEL